MTSPKSPVLPAFELRPSWEPPMLDYREFEEDGPLNAILERQPGVDLKDWFYDESDAVIEEHLAGEYHAWVAEQRTRVAGKLYIASKLRREEESELRKRLEFLDGLEGDLKKECAEAMVKLRDVHRQYVQKYRDKLRENGLSEEQKLAAAEWLKLAAPSHRVWKAEEEYQDLREQQKADPIYYRAFIQGRRVPSEAQKAMERAYQAKISSLWRVVYGLQEEKAELTRGVNHDPAVTLELLDRGSEELMREMDQLTVDEHHEKIRKGYIQDHPNFARIPEHQAAMEGGPWLEQEATDRRMSCELRNGVEEGLARFQEYLDSEYDDGYSSYPADIERLQKEDALLHRQHWQQEATERRMSCELRQGDDEEMAALWDAEFQALQAIYYHPCNEKLDEVLKEHYEAKLRRERMGGLPEGWGLPGCQIMLEQRKEEAQEAKERRLRAEPRGVATDEVAPLLEGEAGVQERSLDEYNAPLVSAREREEAETWEFIEHSGDMAEGLPPPGTSQIQPMIGDSTSATPKSHKLKAFRKWYCG